MMQHFYSIKYCLLFGLLQNYPVQLQVLCVRHRDPDRLKNDERCKNNVAHWGAECALFILLCNTSVTLRVSRDGTCTSFYQLILAFVTGWEGDWDRRIMGSDVEIEDTHKKCFSYEIEGMLNALLVWSIKTFVWCWFKGRTVFSLVQCTFHQSVLSYLSILSGDSPMETRSEH